MINMLHAFAGPECIRRIFMRFPRVVFDGDHVTARGRVTAVREEDGRRYADCEIWLDRDDGDRPLVGTATVELRD